MDINWSYPRALINMGGTEKIDISDANRQSTTAEEIIRRLSNQPGVILADEVGMGKTFVAFAVAAAVVHSTNGSDGPVIFLVPSHMLDKWRSDWDTFCQYCIHDEKLKKKLKMGTLNSVADLLRERELLNTKRKPVLLMKLSSFTHRLQDPLFKLAIIKSCFQEYRLGPTVRKRFLKWASTLLSSKSWLNEKIVGGLLRRDIAEWDSYLLNEGRDKEAVSRVPNLIRKIKKMELSPLVYVLRNDLPGDKGRVTEDTLKHTRRELNNALDKVYKGFLRDAMWHSPLVILDEAHHLKNPKTKISSIFADKQEVDDCLGFLDDTFSRMVFLTATPFQLGHREMIEVLSRFKSINWNNEEKKTQFKSTLRDLENSLNESQTYTRRLDSLWGTLKIEEMMQEVAEYNIDLVSTEPEKISEIWWELVLSGKLPSEKASAIVELVEKIRSYNALAQKALRPWVIRHAKPKQLKGKTKTIPRRVFYNGAAIDPKSQIIHDNNIPVPYQEGLAVDGVNTLPFLLAIRAQAELSQIPGAPRTYFAEGLASSYEAFHHTTKQKANALDEDDGIDESIVDEINSRYIAKIEKWYVDRIKEFVPARRKVNDIKDGIPHPKIQAVVSRVVGLWNAGEKVLVFVFYRQTAAALQRYISFALEQSLFDSIRKKVGDPSLKEDVLRETLQRTSQRLSDPKNALYRKTYKWLEDQVNIAFEKDEITTFQHKQLLNILLRYIRSFGFIARYFPFEDAQFYASLGLHRQSAPAVQDALLASFHKPISETVKSPAKQIEHFLKFMKECSGRNITNDSSTRSTEFDLYLQALNSIQVGARQSGNADAENYVRVDKTRLLANVRSVTGVTPRPVRSTVMRAFNSPLFPEILVASQILAEGVDLQRSCRMVLHHDLCWNPSLLEQRVGRIDRLGSISSEMGLPMHIFEPYLMSTADEKMYKVVKDRERWFQIVMGDQFELSEIATEARSRRAPLPTRLAKELTYDLSIVNTDT
jgi:superfamily II DNA or RNA helicase